MGSKSTPTTTTQAGSTSTTIPDWLTSAGQQAVQMGQDLSTRPYQPYTGQIVATPGDFTNAAYSQIAAVPGSQDQAFQQASNQWGGLLSNLQSLDPNTINSQLTNPLFQNYSSNVYTPASGLYGNAQTQSQGLLGGYLQGSPLTAAQVGSNAQALMSPYTSSVIDPTNALMKQQLGENLATIGAGANQAGAFGGSRQGVMEGVAQSQAALGSEQYLGNLLNNQWNSALPVAYNIGSLGSQQGYNAASALAQQGYGTAGALSNLLSGGYSNAAQQGLNLAGTNLQLGSAAAQQMPSLATQWQTNDLATANAMSAVGSAQQQQQQAELNAQLGQYYEQQGWPVQDLDVLLSSLTGVPYSTSGTTDSTTQGQQTRNVGAGVLGGAASGAAIGTALFPGVGTAIGAIGGGLLGAF